MKFLQLNNKSIKDIAATFFNQAWRLISGPLMLLLIPLYLTEEQQGYWYLFGSVAALSTFADLGFSNIILQFSAHEYASLKIGNEGLLEGQSENIKKMGSFLRFVIRWLSTICAIVYPIIFIVGIYFLVRDKVLSVYFIPWIIYSIGSLVNFFNNSILSFIEGMDQISKIQKSRLIVAIINSVVVISSLLLHLNIYALAFGIILSASFMFITIFKTFGKILKQLWKESVDFSYPWKKEILPLFKKYVLSFASGYFLFQIYTPLMHYFHGPIYSGKIGISMSLVTAMFTFSTIFVYTITPRINMLIEKKDWLELDKIFNKRLMLSGIAYLFIACCFFVFINLFSEISLINKIVSRFLPWQGLVILISAYFIQVFINSWAVYLRGHKIEPYWYTGIVSAVWVFVITVLIGKFMSPDYFFLGLLSSYIWGTPWSYIIYRNWKKKLHV